MPTSPTPAPHAGDENASRRRQVVQSRAGDTSDRILHCAREAFAAHGFAAANVRDIAKAAGTTHSMIRYHFGTKDDLWREAVRDMFELLQRSVIDPTLALTGISSQERFKRMLRLYTRYCAEHPEHARITFAETIVGGERLEWMVDNFVRANHADLFEFLHETIQGTPWENAPLPSVMYAVVGMVQLPFLLEKEAIVSTGYDFMTDEAIERHADTVIALLVEGNLRPKP